MKKSLLLLLLAWAFSGQAQSNLNQGLVGYFPLNNDVNDYSSLHIDGVNYNATPQSSNGRNYYNFNGTNAFIYAGNDNRGISNQVSVSVWVRTTSNDFQWVVGHYNHLDDRGYQVIVYYGHVQLRGRDGGNQFYILNDDDLINDGQWHHIVGLFDKNRWTLIVDCQIKSFLYTDALNPSYVVDTQPLSISKYPQLNNGTDPLYFDGDIDEVRIYNRILSLCDICELQNYKDETAIIQNEASPLYNLKIYPNPTDSLLTIELPQNLTGKYYYEIYDNNNKLIFNGHLEKQKQVDIKKLSKGIYFIVVKNNNQVLNGKFIVE